MKPVHYYLLLTGLTLSPGINATELPVYNGPDFIATQQIQEPGNENSQGTVYFSKAGSRMEFDTPIGKTMAGFDFAKGKCWFASVSQKIYMEGKVDMKTGDCDADLNMGPPGEETVVGGLMASEPCEGYSNKQKLGNKTLAGRDTEEWQCADPRIGQAKHWFDTKLKLVIREETPYSRDELTSFQFKKVDPAIFASPKGFKRVNKNEFMQALMSAVPR